MVAIYVLLLLARSEATNSDHSIVVACVAIVHIHPMLASIANKTSLKMITGRLSTPKLALLAAID